MMTKAKGAVAATILCLAGLGSALAQSMPDAENGRRSGNDADPDDGHR